MKRGNILIFSGLILILSAISLFTYNIFQSVSAGEVAESMVRNLEKMIPDKEKSDFDNYPQRAMTTVSTNEVSFIGVIKISSLDIELPVSEEFSYENMNVGACRCSGSVYTDNLVIAGHNFYRHFGQLSNLSKGDNITFYDFEGKTHNYKVLSQEIVQPFDTETMYNNDKKEWDMTLFTCTWSGQERFALRCVRV